MKHPHERFVQNAIFMIEVTPVIEKLMDEEFRYGEPEYSEAEGEISEICQKLNERLDEEGRGLLGALSDAYIHQNNLIVKDVFRSGFCAAVGLMMDYMKQKG